MKLNLFPQSRTLADTVKPTGSLDNRIPVHNFKIAATLQNCTPVAALAGMMCKHTVSVYDLIQQYNNGATISAEMWDEKITDSINYLLLLKAAVTCEK